MIGLASFYDELRKSIRREGGQRAWAQLHRISESYVSDVLNARRDPGVLILDAMGFERVTMYRRNKNAA